MGTTTEDLTSQVDGVATSFTTPLAFLPGSLIVYLNGKRRVNPGEFVETSVTTFDWITGPGQPPPRVGDTLQVQFELAVVVAFAVDPTL